MSDAQVGYFLADLVRRLRTLEDGLPTHWFYVGKSGEKIAHQMLRLLTEEERARLTFYEVNYSRNQSAVSVLPTDEIKTFLERTLLLDGPIHSGRTMLAIARWLAAGRQGALE